jgi:hypothetical protein
MELDLISYTDIQLRSKLQERLVMVPNANFIFCPVDLAFSFAKEKFGNIIFPLYVLSRFNPFIKYEHASSANFRQEYTLSAEQSVKPLHIQLGYQLDFFANNMNYMNLSNIDYYESLEKNPQFEFDFFPVGVDDEYQAALSFPSDPIGDNNINNMFNNGRYFRYTYPFDLQTLYFNIIENVTYTELEFTIYEKRYDEEELLRTITIEGATE